MPRVDVVSTYVGADDVAIRAVVAAGARGIVVNGFAFNGLPAAGQKAGLEEAHRDGVAVVLANRGGGGRVPRHGEPSYPLQPFVKADNLTAQKARILTALALTKHAGDVDLQRCFDEY
jgi:L-asparaginase/Glu-tRNA(Gln) amidotransferase subunit D